MTQTPATPSRPLPGTRLLRWAGDWFDPATVSGVFEPLVADWQHEWQRASTSRGRAMASLRGQWAFLVSAGRLAPGLLVSPMPLGLATALFVRVTACVVLASLLLLAPFVLDYRSADARGTLPLWSMLWHLLPSTVTVALPFAVIGAVDVLRSKLPAPHARGRKAALQITLLAVGVMVLAAGWWTANSNQQFRELMASRFTSSPPPRGPRELTIVELFRHAPIPLAEINSRLTLILLPLLLITLRWKALSLRGSSSGIGFIFEFSWALAVLSVLAIVRVSSQALGFPVGLPLPGLVLVAALTLSPWVSMTATSVIVNLVRHLRRNVLGAAHGQD